jgi:ArsR family transcriptional regulator
MTGRRELLQRIAARLRALADPTRLEIVHALEAGELCVGDVIARVGGSQANVSKHLAVLRRAGVVESRREGLNVFYRTADGSAFTICRCVRDALARRLASDERAITGGIDERPARRAPRRAAAGGRLPSRTARANPRRTR